MTPDELRARLRAIGASGRPVIVGPWLSEVGFELLYWIPFLRWAIAMAKIPRDRLWVLSRGGCRSWYADISDQYLDLYDAATPEAVAALNQRRIEEQAREGTRIGLRRRQRTAKQLYLSPVENAMIADASARAAIASPAVLHPSLLYNAFRPVWRQHQKRHLIPRWREMTRAARISVQMPSPYAAPYVAVKFYASQACPTKPSFVRDVQNIVLGLAESTQVVLLHTGTAYDEHGEFPIPTHPRIHRPLFDPARNLDQQSAIIAGADAFVGTYGGFAYLAPFLGVPSVSCYAVDNFRHDHLGVIGAAAARLGVPFRVCPLKDGAAVVRHDCQRWLHAA
jgi:ADP-heptose:LPS heptosyltransferase